MGKQRDANRTHYQSVNLSYGETRLRVSQPRLRTRRHRTVTHPRTHARTIQPATPPQPQGTFTHFFPLPCFPVRARLVPGEDGTEALGCCGAGGRVNFPVPDSPRNTTSTKSGISDTAGDDSKKSMTTTHVDSGRGLTQLHTATEADRLDISHDSGLGTHSTPQHDTTPGDIGTLLQGNEVHTQCARVPAGRYFRTC